MHNMYISQVFPQTIILISLVITLLLLDRHRTTKRLDAIVGTVIVDAFDTSNGIQVLGRQRCLQKCGVSVQTPILSAFNLPCGSTWSTAAAAGGGGAFDYNGPNRMSSSWSSFPLRLSFSHPDDVSSSQSLLSLTTRDDENDNHNNDDDMDETNRPPWMKCVHGIVHKTGPLNDAVSRIANVTLSQANDLIAIGAVWARMDVLTPEEILSQYQTMTVGRVTTGSGGGRGGNSAKRNADARLQYADLPPTIGNTWNPQRYVDHDDDNEQNGEGNSEDLDDYIEQMESQRYNRIMTPSTIAAGTDLRIYPFPRRFPACKEVDESKLLYQDTTFIIVDKPPMLPTQPDASNYFENCPGCVATNLGPFVNIQGETVERPLLCHRVDSCVSGCVVLSKDENGQAVFARLQRERKVKKVYKAVTKKEVPVGMHVHWMWGEMTRRGRSGGPPCQLVSHEVPLNRKKAKSWTRCILEVVQCVPVDVDPNNEYGYDPGREQHYESTIRLVTGRKHQVRAMLSSLGSPIICDTLYEPIAGMTLDMLNGGGEEAIIMDMAIERCRTPQKPIGLQAHAILFGGIKAKAGRPWWGDGTTGSQ